jgi:hypothetical protein
VLGDAESGGVVMLRVVVWCPAFAVACHYKQQEDGGIIGGGRRKGTREQAMLTMTIVLSY